MVSKETRQTFRFLSDKPLGEGEILNFGHDGLASAIAKIVRCCSGTLSIGLFGGWGSGKSTIAESAARELKSEKLPVVIFDVWKHETDWLRPAFLKESFDQLKAAKDLKGDFELPYNLEYDYAEPTAKRQLIDKKLLKILRNSVIFAAAATGVAIAAFWFFDGLDWLRSQASSVVSISSVLLLFKFGVDLAKSFQNAPSYTFHERMQNPHEFEKNFNELVEDIKGDQILFVIDNLDRVTHDASIQMLSMIKTFLEPTIKSKNVSFLIPCDDRAIREHVRHVYLNSNTVITRNGKSGQSSSFQPNEFLKKFFNSIVWIPEFIPSELESFARECLRKTEVTDFDDSVLAWLIAAGFRENPRQIKQFINTLLSSFILAQGREESRDLPAGFTHDNLKQLCLYTLLCTRFPEIVEDIMAEDVIRLRRAYDKTPKNQWTPEREQLWQFVEQAYTAVPPIDNLRPYFSLRLSEAEKKLPGVTELFIKCIDGDFDSAEGRANEMAELEGKAADFNAVLRDELDRIVNPVAASNLIGGVLRIAEDHNIAFDRPTIAQIQYTVTQRIRDRIDLLSPMAFLRAGLLDDDRFARRIVDEWFERANVIFESKSSALTHDLSLVKELFHLMSERQHLGQGTRELQRKFLSRDLLDNVEVMTSVIEATNLAASIINTDVADEYAKLMVEAGLPADTDDRLTLFTLLNKMSLYSDTDEFIMSGLSSYESLIQELPTGDNVDSVVQIWVEVFDSLNEFLLGQSQNLEKTEIEPSIVSLDAKVAVATAATPEGVSNAVSVPVLLTLSKYGRDPKRLEIETRLKEWFRNCSAVELKEVFEAHTESGQLIEDSAFSMSIEENAVEDEAVMAVVYTVAGDSLRSKLVKRQIEEQPDAALITLNTITEPIPSDVDVSSLALEQSALQLDKAKLPYLKLAAHQECDGDPEKQSKFISEIVDLLMSSDEIAQSKGHDLFVKSEFIPGNLRRDAAKKLFDWLKSPELTIKYQPRALAAISHGIERFNQYERGDFAQFCWDELIRKSDDSAEIAIGFDLLKIKELEVGFDDKWKGNFYDVLQRAEGDETSDEVRAEIKSGLMSLKRSEASMQEEEEFWARVEAIGSDGEE